MVRRQDTLRCSSRARRRSGISCDKKNTRGFLKEGRLIICYKVTPIVELLQRRDTERDALNAERKNFLFTFPSQMAFG